MIESPGDWAVFTDPADFGQPVTYTPQGDTPKTITGIFTAAYAALSGGGPTVATTLPVFVVGQLALTFIPQAGDTLTTTQANGHIAAGTVLRVADPQPDGSGLIRMTLERI